MSRTGRPPSTTKRVEVKIRLDRDILGPLDMICLDPLRGAVAYGQRSIHVEKALTEYLAKYYPAIGKPVDALGNSGHSNGVGILNQPNQRRPRNEH